MDLTVADKVDTVLRIGDECLTLCALCIEADERRIDELMSAIESSQVGLEQVVRVARNNAGKLSRAVLGQIEGLAGECYAAILRVWEDLSPTGEGGNGGGGGGGGGDEKLAEMIESVRLDDDRVGLLTVAVLTSRRPTGELPIDLCEFQQSGATKFKGPQRSKKEQSPSRNEIMAHRPAAATPVLYKDKMSTQPDRLLEMPTDEWADLNLMRQWIRQCSEQHNDHCSLSAAGQAVFSQRPKWLIDVNRKCIVAGNEVQEYAALSYVWGDVGCLFRARMALFDTMLTDGYFGRDDVVKRLPRTVVDSILSTRLLRLKYLWVDCVCIAEDNPVEMKQELEAMASIYANSHLTIVATTGASDAGLRGLEGMTAPFTRDADAGPSFHEALERHHIQVKRSSWHNRGWTFQEQILSRRIIVISANGITWECHCAVWLEGMQPTEGQCGALERVVFQGPAVVSNSKLIDFGRHVEVYNQRDLSYVDDITRAFAGVMTSLGLSFRGGFACGIPVAYFDTALMWRNLATLSKRWLTFGDIPERPTLPSWSWMLWQGDLYLDFWTDESNHDLKPLVEWSYKTHMGGSWNPITKPLSSITTEAPPQPRYRVKAAATNFDMNFDMFDDFNLSLEDDENDQDDENDGGSEPSWQMHHCPLYLHARIQRAFFRLDRKKTIEGATYWSPADGINYSVSKACGQTAGRLTAVRSGGLHPGTICEVVAVSETTIAIDFTIGTTTGSTDKGPDEALHGGLHGEMWINVLWIEWYKGVAYRRGMGQVKKSVWLNEESSGRIEEIDLVLG